MVFKYNNLGSLAWTHWGLDMLTGKPATVTVAFHDQSIGLIFFGVLQILLGCAIGLLGMMHATFDALRPMCHPDVVALRSEALIPVGVSFYLLPTVTLIWLGIGSIRARRWAWALTVVLSWFWLIVGLSIVVARMVFAPRIMRFILSYHGKMSIEDASFVQHNSVAMALGFCVLLPIAFLIFYQRLTVRATCNWRDSRTCWTDRCPLPVLAASIVLASSAMWMSWWIICCCLLALFPCGELPAWFAFFTTCYFVTSFGGATHVALGAMLWMLIMVFSAYLAWGVYRLKMSAWWGAMFFYVVSIPAGTWAFSHSNIIKSYEKMCVPSYRSGITEPHGFLQPSSTMFYWLTILTGSIAICYLLCVHHYFIHNGKESGKSEQELS